MKKLSFFLMAMILSFAPALRAADVTETIAMKKFGGLSTSSYENVTKTGTSDKGTEMVAYAFNPTTGQVRGNKTAIAGASITSKDDSKNWSLYNTQAMPGAIKKITVTQTATGTNKFQNNLYVALGTTNQGAVTTVTGAQKNTTGTATEFTFEIDETQGYTYFKLLSNVKFTSGSVAGVVVTVTYAEAAGNPDAVKYTVTANVNDPAMGTVSGAGEYEEGKTATLTANANAGYRFVNWSNGSTENPLKITVTEDVEITANFEVIPPMTCAEAAAAPSGATVVLNPFDVVAVVKGAGYIYIKDESGVNLIYDFNLDDQLKAGDHVEGFVGTSSPYNGLPELKPTVAFADLTVTPGTAPEPTLFTEAPAKADVNKYVKFENVTLTANATFTTSSATNATMVVNGTNVTLRNNFKLAATLSKDKAYNIVGFAAIYNSTIQVYFLSAEEYVAPEPVKFNVTVTAENGTVEGAGEYAENAEVTLTATPAEGYEFVNWTSGETVVSTENPYKFTVTADVALVANFQEVVNVVTKEEKTTCVPGTLADGKVTHDLPCCVIVQEQGESTTALKSVAPWEAPSKSIMTITPKEGVTILTYAINTKNTTLGTYLGKSELTNATKTAASNGLVTFTVTNGTEPVVMKFVSTTIKFHEITFTYTVAGGTEPVKYTVTVKAENGTVEGAGEYEEGAEATLTATPAEGYEFVNWTVEGTEVSTENPYKFTVTADVEVVANFKEATVVEPTTETVYFINNKGWSKVNAYAWEPVQNANWPGVAATKEAEQIGGYDVYSFTADAGKYANVIFNNGSGQQTADLKWTAGKYVINNQWYTKEEAEAQLVKPVEYEYVYFVDNQGWGKANIYTWTPEVGTWPGVAMTKEAEQLAGYDVYSYKAEKGTSFGGVIFNNGSGVQTGDLKWTAGKYYVKDGWYTKEEAIEKLSGPVTPPVITYVLMGIAGDWTTGIALTVNPDNANEYVLLSQEIAEGDAVKVVTLTDGVATAWCGNVDPASAAYTADDMGNIVLAPGKYDFYYKVAEDLIYIGAVEPEVITYELNGGEFPAVVVPTNAELWEAFKPYYNNYYGLARADQPIDKVSTFANAKMQEIMTDEASEYKWLGDYVQSVATAAGVPLSTDMASANESGWRWAVHAFFNAAAGQYGAAGIDFTEAGKQEVWGAAYEAEYGVVLPTEPVAEDYVLPTPVKEGYTFVGWYDNAEGTGEAYTVIPAGWAGTLYAIWEAEAPTVEYTEIVMSNLVVTPYGEYDVLEASDAMTGIAVMLGVDADGKLVEGSEVTWNGTSMTILSSDVFTKTYSEDLATDVYNGKLVIEFYGEEMGLDLYMYGTGAASSVDVVITDANITVDEWGSYLVSAPWEDGILTIEVSDTEYEGFMMLEYTITEDDWYIWMAYTATVTTVDNVMTIEGEFTDNYTGTTYNVTISGNLPNGTGTGLEDATVTIKAVKKIQNGQLIIEKDGVQYNANGAVIK